MFKHTERLSKQKDIENVFINGRVFYLKLLGLRILANNLKKNRFTVIANLKVSKKAVQRNRAKRQVRAALREQKLKQGYDIVAICFSSIIQANYQEIKNEVQALCQKHHLL